VRKTMMSSYRTRCGFKHGSLCAMFRDPDDYPLTSELRSDDAQGRIAILKARPLCAQI
jgi:hypothetical protein